MTPDEAFLHSIHEARDDEASRLIYADFLEERGDRRGDFLRIEHRLWSLTETNPDYPLLHRRLTELSGTLDIRWIAAVCRVHLETGPWHEHPQRCPLNVIGPFYTCGDCLACEAPENEASDLLAELGQGNSTTYFVRQPRTAAEIERACRAAEVCCVADVRYGGTDPKIIARFRDGPLYCDYLLGDSARLLRAPSLRPGQRQS